MYYGTRAGGPGGYVFGLYVHPGQAGRGAGRALLHRAEVRLRERGGHPAGGYAAVSHRPYYETCAGPAGIRRAVTAELADAVPGPVSYSDLGFMLHDGNAFALGGVSGHAARGRGD